MKKLNNKWKYGSDEIYEQLKQIKRPVMLFVGMDDKKSVRERIRILYPNGNCWYLNDTAARNWEESFLCCCFVASTLIDTVNAMKRYDYYFNTNSSWVNDKQQIIEVVEL